MTISFITTVFNEEKTIFLLLESLILQTLLPNEIIIVDAFSHDKTFEKLHDYKKIFNEKFPRINFLIIKKRGNRSIGRNAAIKKAKSDIIVVTDAGCILQKNWIKNITEKFKNPNVDVVAGYYKAKTVNDFQKALVPYVFVMPDKVNTDTFLPATRSVAFRKKVWQKVGGFEEKYSHNEDYVFAKALKKSDAKIVFAKKAIVYWIPRNTFRETFVMFFRFAYGDAESKILRPKVIFIFARYIMAAVFLIWIIYSMPNLIYVFILLVLFYFLWAVTKNYKYIGKLNAFYYLPVLQLTSDMAVIVGTIVGLMNLISK